MSALLQSPTPRVTLCPPFTITGAPRTKKAHSQIIRLKGEDRSILIPSPQYLQWFKDSMYQAPGLRVLFTCSGINLPIRQPVAVSARFFRDRFSGDLCGYLQALGDYLQAPRPHKTKPGKLSRDGAGIIGDDAQIVSWDGSRLLKDSVRPRIEVQITILETGQMDLVLEEEF